MLLLVMCVVRTSRVLVKKKMDSNREITELCEQTGSWVRPKKAQLSIGRNQKGDFLDSY